MRALRLDPGPTGHAAAGRSVVPSRPRRKFLAAALAGLMLAGCVSPPKYEKPFVDIPPSFKELADWKVAEPADALPKGNWWVVFNDPVLQDLLNQVDISNQNIKATEAQYRASRALVRAAQAG